MSSVNSDPTAPVDGPVPAVEDQENDGDQEGQDARNTLGGDESGVDGGGSPVGVEDVDALAPNVRVTVENLSSSEHHMPVDDPASHRGENSPAASAVSSIESTESMGDPRRSVPGGNGGRGGGRIIAGDNSGGGTSARELERVGSDGIDDCQVDDGELSGSLDDDSRYVWALLESRCSLRSTSSWSSYFKYSSVVSNDVFVHRAEL